MQDLSFYLFVGTCAALLLWGLRTPSRIYQYPFLMGGMFTAFLVPQAIGLLNNPGMVPLESVAQALLMGCLCMAMAWAGYRRRPLHWVLRVEISPLRIERVYIVGFVISLVSWAAIFGINSIPDEEVRSGTGLFTILAFFSGLSGIAFPVFLSLAIARPNPGNVAMALVSGYPLYALLMAGRRAGAVAFLIIILLTLFFQKRWLVPRWLALGGVLGVAYMIPVIAEMRGEFWSDLLSGNFSAIDWAAPFSKLLDGDTTLELRNAAAIVWGTSVTGIYGLGTGYWDAFIFQHVPGQLVGRDLKDALMFSWTTSVWSEVGYQATVGSTLTAMGDTYLEFWYFGCLFFFFQGYLFKNIWYLAVYRNSLIAQLLYMGLMPVTLVSVSHGTYWFIRGAPLVFVAILAIHFFAKSRPGGKRLRHARIPLGLSTPSPKRVN